MKTIKNANHPVAVAVAPLRVAAETLAEKYAREDADAVAKQLADAGWDLDVAAPDGNSFKDGRDEYRAKHARHCFFIKLTERAAPKNGRWHERDEKDIRVMSKERIERYVKEAKEDAAASFVGYVNKLVMKMGPAKSATLTALRGSNLWAHSFLDVVMNDGSKERWETKQIWNRSCLGKNFPQWPTRQKEGAKRVIEKKAALVHLNGRALGRSDGKLCIGGYSRMRLTGDYRMDEAQVTCPRCLEYAKNIRAHAANKKGNV